MAIDISKGSHIKSFPNKIASAMGQYGHVYNIELDANADNGTLCGKGDALGFDLYEADTVPSGFAGRIQGKASDGTYYVEVTALGTAPTLYVYNSPVSEYGIKELQNETLYYNKAGEVAQGMELHIGDVYSISANGFTGTPAAEYAVTYSAGKYVVAGSTSSGGSFEA